MADETPRVPPSTIAPFALRLQPDVKAALEKAAQLNGRSLNAEIASRLEDSLQGASEIETRLSALEREMSRVWDWLAPVPETRSSGLAERLKASNWARGTTALNAFREKNGYDEESLPDPRDTDDPQSFYDRVRSDIDASPDEVQHEMQKALDELMEELYPAPLGWASS